MRNEPPDSRLGTGAGGACPRCVFVTGPRGAGKTRWLQRRIRERVESRPDARIAVVLAEEGRTRMEAFVREVPGVSVRRLLLPCTCCLALADLPGTLRETVEAVRPGWLFLEVPALVAAGLVAEFDRVLGWPREVAVCLDAGWGAALRDDSMSPFETAIIGLADCVVPSRPQGERLRADTGAHSPTISDDPA